MRYNKDLEKRFDEGFSGPASFCSCYEGDLYNVWPDARDELLDFIEEECGKAVEEDRRMLLVKVSSLWNKQMSTEIQLILENILNIIRAHKKI